MPPLNMQLPNVFPATSRDPLPNLVNPSQTSSFPYPFCSFDLPIVSAVLLIYSRTISDQTYPKCFRRTLPTHWNRLFPISPFSSGTTVRKSVVFPVYFPVTVSLTARFATRSFSFTRFTTNKATQVQTYINLDSIFRY